MGEGGGVLCELQRLLEELGCVLPAPIPLWRWITVPLLLLTVLVCFWGFRSCEGGWGRWLALSCSFKWHKLFGNHLLSFLWSKQVVTAAYLSPWGCNFKFLPSPENITEEFLYCIVLFEWCIFPILRVSSFTIFTWFGGKIIVTWFKIKTKCGLRYLLLPTPAYLTSPSLLATGN